MLSSLAYPFKTFAITYALSIVIKIAGRKEDAKLITLTGYTYTAIGLLTSVFGAANSFKNSWIGKGLGYVFDFLF